MHILEAGARVFLLRFTPDSRRLLSGVRSNGQSVHFDLWTLPEGDRVRLDLPPLNIESWWFWAWYGSAAAVHPSGDGLYLAWDGQLFAFRTDDGAALPVPAGVKAHQVVISPGGDRLLTVYITDDHRQLTALTLTGTRGRVVWQHDMPQVLRHVGGFLPDGERFVTVEDRVRVRAFDTGAEVASAPYPANRAYHPQVSPDGRHLGVIGYTSMYVYDLPALGKPRRITGSRSSGDFVSFAFHPGGRALAVIHGGPTLVKVYDPATLRPTQTYRWKLGPLGCVAYSPDGTLGAAGSDDGRIVVWDVDE